MVQSEFLSERVDRHKVNCRGVECEFAHDGEKGNSERGGRKIKGEENIPPTHK
jgi:hypothetical protein